MDVLTSMVLRFSFNLSGIVPNFPTTMGITFVLTPIFRISLARPWYFSTFSSSFALTLPLSGIATSITWEFFSILSMLKLATTGQYLLLVCHVRSWSILSSIILWVTWMRIMYLSSTSMDFAGATHVKEPANHNSRTPSQKRRPWQTDWCIIAALLQGIR